MKVDINTYIHQYLLRQDIKKNQWQWFWNQNVPLSFGNMFFCFGTIVFLFCFPFLGKHEIGIKE